MAAARQRDDSYSTNCVVIAAVKAPLASTVEIEIDYRVLGPVLVTDPNGNRSAVKVEHNLMIGRKCRPPQGRRVSPGTAPRRLRDEPSSPAHGSRQASNEPRRPGDVER
ncbi:MAG: hypothetical protein IPM54_36295 [Polyangiaceae bacterium]|nr:hypothetical protein [Polyangiaceae bacterium]